MPEGGRAQVSEASCTEPSVRREGRQSVEERQNEPGRGRRICRRCQVYGSAMNILVIGASRGTGALCVKSALAKGHTVSAFSRTPARLDITHAALTKIAGDFHDPA